MRLFVPVVLLTLIIPHARQTTPAVPLAEHPRPDFERAVMAAFEENARDLARVGGRYSDDWHRLHLNNPRDLVPESNMPAYPWLAKTPVAADDIERHLQVLRTLGHPYTDEDVATAKQQLAGKNEQDALVAYLQVLGTSIKSKR